MIEIDTDKKNYAPGEDIKITLTLKLEKPVKARALIVTLECNEKKRIQTTRVLMYDEIQRKKELGYPIESSVETFTSYQEVTIFKKERKITEKGEYKTKEYKVLFKLPQNANPTSYEYGHDNLIHIWKLKAKLDIPLAPDMNAEKEIFVTGLSV